MKFSGEKRRKNGVFDVHASPEKPHSSKSFFRNLFYDRNVLNLKPKFRIRHPWIWALALVVIAAGAFFGIRQLGTKAEIQDFYPSTCLGNWQNPANAEGAPETLATASTSFTGSNSALYAASDSQVFCGGFLPTNFATSGQITNVGLTLVWQIGDTPTSSVPTSTAAVEVASPSTSTSTDQSSSTTDTISTTTASSSISVVTGTSTATSTKVISRSVATTTATSTNTTNATSTLIMPTSTTATTTGATSTPTANSTSTPAPTSTPPSVATTTTTVATTTTPTSTPPTSSTTTTATSSGVSYFIRQLIPFAFADDSTTTASSVVLGPPLTADLTPASSVSSSSPSSSTSTSISPVLNIPIEATGTGSSTATAPAVVVPPPVPDENFLDVSYSTDGQTWISIGKVNVDNWPQFTVTLPISDWKDLQNLQIRVQGIPTTQDPVPPVYLDGMLVEVHYDTALLTDATQTASSTDEETSSTTGAIAPSSRMTLVDPGAQQSCDVQPFSQVLPIGGTAAFTVNLHPSLNGVSYQLQMGHLPLGVSADIGSPSGPIAATSSLTFEAETSTQPGSFNIAVVYQENETDGTELANFCQLNIDVQ